MSPTEVLRLRAVLDPLLWLRRYAPASVPARFARYHRQLVELPEPGERQARIVFRGSAKSTLTRATAVHAAAHQRVRGVLIVRATYGDAKSDRESIERTAAIAGIEAVNDGDTKMVLVGEVPIWTRTPGGAVRGIHWLNPRTGEIVRPDLILIDDLETRKTARSKEQTKAIETWLFSDALATAAQGHPARVIFLGTPITPSSLAAKAMRREAPFDTWAEPLIVPYETDGAPTWPATFDPELRANTPELTMATEYDLDPLPPGTLLFPPRRTVWHDLDGSPSWRTVVAVDPAADGDDATGMVAMALTARGLYVIDAEAYTGPSVNGPEAVGRFVRRVVGNGWNVEGVTIESVGAWEFFRREVMKQLDGLRVTGEPPTKSKVERALPLTVWHQQGAIAAHTRLRGSTWDAELHSFDQDGETATDHDDMVDATAWAAAPLTRGWSYDPPATTWTTEDAA